MNVITAVTQFLGFSKQSFSYLFAVETIQVEKDLVK